MCQASKAHHTPFQRGTKVTSPKVAENRYFDLAPRVLVAAEGFWVHAGRGGRADRGAGAHPSGLWLQSARGALGTRGPTGVGDHHPENLNDKSLGTRHERWRALERENAERAIELTPEQAAFLEKLNPCFRERYVESDRPGELLSADTFMVGTLKGIYLHAVVDTFGSYAFDFLHVSKQPEAAVAVLHNDVLPFYARLDLPIGAVLTDNGREFCGTERHP
jgi:hypothetical protein